MLTQIQSMLDPLVPYLAQHYGQSCWIDTEALAQTGGFNQTMSLIKREDLTPEERSSLRFWCFDLVLDPKLDERTLDVRRKDLKRLFGKKASPPFGFCLTRRKRAHTQEELQTIYWDTLDQGHEGVMLKFGTSPYRARRSSAWLKWKPTNTVEGEILGTEPGRDGSKHQNRLGAFVVRRQDTKETIRVGGGLTDTQRTDFWTKRNNLIGKILEFKEETRAGALTTTNFPRFIRMRPDRSQL